MLTHFNAVREHLLRPCDGCPRRNNCKPRSVVSASKSVCHTRVALGELAECVRAVTKEGA